MPGYCGDHKVLPGTVSGMFTVQSLYFKIDDDIGMSNSTSHMWTPPKVIAFSWVGIQE